MISSPTTSSLEFENRLYAPVLKEELKELFAFSIILGVVLLAIFIVPVIWLNHRGKK